MNKPRVKVCRADRVSGVFWLVRVDGQLRHELTGPGARRIAHQIAGQIRNAMQPSSHHADPS